MVKIKTQEEIKIIAEGGKILAATMKELEKMAKPGITTLELDRAAEALIVSKGARPAFKGYAGFPYSLCASTNENIVHGFPSNYVLKNGDLLKLDLGVLYKGFNTDMAMTVAVGEVSFETKRLINVTKKSLRLGIKKAKVGNTIGDIGNTIQRFVEDQGFGVVRDLCGHGIGKTVHEDPKVPNFGKRGSGENLVEGMVICIEPMVTMGDYKIKPSKDGYGYATSDGSLSAHFEHTIVITEKGPVVLTEP
ncbi:MAG: type I methionyl aminopeptidase [Candidatus Staskawiczbacteria bacterium]|nr:type I methionyl aminopeptidase [Candidatus Staskawiczbacteria bacterium]